MAAVLQGCSHLQHAQPRTLTPGASAPHTALPCGGRRQRRGVAAAARGRRPRGDTLGEQLADLLPPQEAAPPESPPQPRRVRRQSKKQQPEQRRGDAEEEDVEIFNIDNGWAEGAFEGAEELAAALEFGAAGDAASGRSTDGDGAGAGGDDTLDGSSGSGGSGDEHIDFEALAALQGQVSMLQGSLRSAAADSQVADSAAAADSAASADLAAAGCEALEGVAQLEEGLVAAEAAAVGEIGDDGWPVLEDDYEEPGGETQWTTSNYEFDSDDEEEEEGTGGAGAAEGGEEAAGGDAAWSSGALPFEDLDDEDDDDGWTVSAVPDDYRVEKASQGSAALREPQAGSALAQLLDSMPPEMARRLRAQDEAAALEQRNIDPRSLEKAAARRRTHRKLRIISGVAGGKRLLSPQGDVVRPMMEMVRAAVFSMIQSRKGCVGRLPDGSRWLDLFAGTGSIGLEALSRGCERATFVELDPWVTQKCLQPNIDACGLRPGATVVTTKAEAFLQRAAAAPGYAGGPFDFISVCPPYLLVSYPELFQLLEASPLAKPTSIILVEYPKRLAHQIPDTLCGLPKVRDRKYGRTLLALFAPAEEAGTGDDGTWQSYV